MLAIRRILPCCRSLHSSGFPRRPATAAARTRVPPTHSQISFHHVTAQRLNRYFRNYGRTIATTSSTSGDAVGNIQSTHYHLIYTCKVPLFAQFTYCMDIAIVVSAHENVAGTLFFHPVYLNCISMHVSCRFAPPGPSRRYPNTLTTKVWWSWLVRGVKITTSSLITSAGFLIWKEKGRLFTLNQTIFPCLNGLPWCSAVYIDAGPLF